MTANPNLTISDGLLMGGGALIGLSLSVYFCLRAWRSTAEQWAEFNRSHRPKSWSLWPIYGDLWRHFDRHTTLYLWEARVLSLLGVLLNSFGVWMAGIVLSRGH